MEKKKFKIIIVEDDPYYNQVLTKYVKSLCNERNYPGIKFDIRSFQSGKECIENLDAETEIIVMDYLLDAYDEFPYTGFDLLKQVNKQCRNCKVIIVSGQSNVTVTTELFKEGIYDYIDKNYMPAKRLSSAIQNILSHERRNGLGSANGT
ncbi:MAG TPA: response regulator [Chitinophagales bacterium]|nr:response regulator [Chitinophagales bacterium]